jgi:hypothetical protein
VWQLLGVEQIKIGSHCHGNQGAKNVKFHAMIIFVFLNFLAFWPFPWQR